MAALDLALIEDARRGLRAVANPARARAMQAYMKSATPYLGVQSPGVKAVCKDVFSRHPLGSFDVWRRTVLGLWREATYREERYVAIALTGFNAYRRFQTPAAIAMYEEIITTGAWWDYVDEVAVRRVGPMLLTHRDAVRPRILAWSRSDDLWKRRTAIICQVVAHGHTDLELLYACIEPNLREREFFIRKAIGWSLRAYAWSDPREIAAYVDRNGDRMSGLSRREALKNIGRDSAPLGLRRRRGGQKFSTLLLEVPPGSPADLT
jgi:3-methyladenine DNA glycosylase AlkD